MCISCRWSRAVETAVTATVVSTRLITVAYEDVLIKGGCTKTGAGRVGTEHEARGRVNIKT